MMGPLQDDGAKNSQKMKNQIGPKRVRRESPGAETLCAKNHAPGQRFDQNFGLRGIEKKVKTVFCFWTTS